MKKIFYLLIFNLIFFSCNTLEVENTDIQGEYRGTFTRNDITSNVTLNLTKRNFVGESLSEGLQSPRICNGTYHTHDHTVNFTNICFWTADFDWTLILNNTWQYQLDNNTLTLTKTNGDTYILTRIKAK